MTAGWQGVSDKAKEFVRGCLNVDIGARFTAAEALKHEWIISNGTLPPDNEVIVKHLDNLLKFKADDTLKAATYFYIASQLLSKKDKDDCANTFRVFDSERNCGDGVISPQEWKTVFKKYKPDVSEKEVMDIFKLID